MKTSILCICVAALALAAGIMAADVTVTSTIESKGMVGLMNMAGAQQIMISGEMQKQSSSFKMTNKVAKFLGGGKAQDKIEITRVDKELFWNIEPKDKKYTEQTFAEARAEMEKALADAQKEKNDNLAKHPEDTVQYKMDVKVENTGKTQQIAGYTAHETIVTVTTYGQDKESGEKGTFTVVFDFWVSKDAPGMEAFTAFNKAFAQKFGLYGQGQQSVDNALTSYGIDPKEMYEKMGDLEGMPLMTVVTTMASGSATASAGGTETAAKQETAKESKDEESPSATKANKGLFGKKKDKDKEKAEAGAPGEKQYLFKFTSTVTEISASPIAAGEFEIPAGYTKK
ncbi:MAG: hypothetical protein PHR28_01210 [candidate division Zixibacteria bacterium]|nr:hypothetical protein [candidate division Zixibacteria bacterium]